MPVKPLLSGILRRYAHAVSQSRASDESAFKKSISLRGFNVLATSRSFGWRTDGFLRFAENDVWRKSITAAIVFVPYRFERSHFAEIGHFRQSSWAIQAAQTTIPVSHYRRAPGPHQRFHQLACLGRENSSRDDSQEPATGHPREVTDRHSVFMKRLGEHVLGVATKN